MISDSVNKFEAAISFDLIDFLNRCNAFFTSTNLQGFISFWSGQSQNIDITALQQFEQLYTDYFTVADQIGNAIPTLIDVNTDDFDFIDFIFSLKANLDYVQNLPKYLRTSTDCINVFETAKVTYYVADGDTAESISLKFYGDTEHG